MLLKTQSQLEILPQAMKQVAKLSEAVGEGRYEDLLEILGHHPDKFWRVGWSRRTKILVGDVPS